MKGGDLMTISYRKLIKYRKEALHQKLIREPLGSERIITSPEEVSTQIDRILELTQELIDQHLVNKE
jgi:hypothetical protein